MDKNPNNAAPRSGGQVQQSPDSQESPAAGRCEVAAPINAPNHSAAGEAEAPHVPAPSEPGDVGLATSRSASSGAPITVPGNSNVVCHAPGGVCLGCNHYYGRATVCAYAPNNAAPQETPSGGQEKPECMSSAQSGGHIVPESIPAVSAPSAPCVVVPTPTREQLAGTLAAVREKGLRACVIALASISTYGARDENGLKGQSRDRYDEVCQLEIFIRAAPAAQPNAELIEALRGNARWHGEVGNGPLQALLLRAAEALSNERGSE